MRLTVDQHSSDEVKQLTPGGVDWLSHSYAFLGGTPPGRAHIPTHLFAFKGCLRRAHFRADLLRLDFVHLADQGYGQSVVQTGGDLMFSCSSSSGNHKSSQLPEVLAFNNGREFLAMPKWGSLASGSMGFQFRTSEEDGLLLYHGVRRFENQSSADYLGGCRILKIFGAVFKISILAFELADGHLHMTINLGSGHVRLQCTSRTVNDGQWHSVQLERVSRRGSVTVDQLRTDFSTPGVSANLIVDEPIYVGGVPWNFSTTSLVQYPSTVWTAHLRRGFVGCLKNLRVNGINQLIASVFEKELRGQKKDGEEGAGGGISVGCPTPVGF